MARNDKFKIIMLRIFPKIIFAVFAVVIVLCFFLNFAHAANNPGAPKNVSAVAGDGKATITFAAGTNGGAAITKFTVTSSPGGKSATGTGTATSITVPGLTNGTAYTFTVTATNSSGTGGASAKSNSITPTAGTGLEGASAGASASATNADPGTSVGVSYPNDDKTNAIQSGQSYNYIAYISKLYGFAMKAAIALSILMVVYAGYKYLTSRGDSSAINEAKDILFSTLMGAALLMLVILVGNIAGLNTSAWGI